MPGGPRCPSATDRVGMKTVPGKEGRPAGEGAGGRGPRGAGRRTGEFGVPTASPRLSCRSFWEPAAWCVRPVCSVHTQQAAGPKLHRRVRVEAISRVVFDI